MDQSPVTVTVRKVHSDYPYLHHEGLLNSHSMLVLADLQGFC